MKKIISPLQIRDNRCTFDIEENEQRNIQIIDYSQSAQDGIIYKSTIDDRCTARIVGDGNYNNEYHIIVDITKKMLLLVNEDNPNSKTEIKSIGEPDPSQNCIITINDNGNERHIHMTEYTLYCPPRICRCEERDSRKAIAKGMINNNSYDIVRIIKTTQYFIKHSDFTMDYFAQH
jgi:hypothetical protein